MNIFTTILSAYVLCGICLGAPMQHDQALAASPRLRIRNEGAILVEKREEITDGDDQVVYTWSKPTDKMKREDTEDGDDQVVYTWSKPSEKSKRENSDDGDDQVVYTWSKPAGDA